MIVRLAYFGHNYHGFQYQPDTITVEGILKKYFGNFKYLSRLDSGVSALWQLIKVREKNLNLNQINYYLPDDIILIAYTNVNISFKEDVKGKTYLYLVPKIWIGNKELFKEALSLFIGKKDFRYFRKPRKEEENTICEIFSINIKEDKYFYQVYISGDRFLWQMVRRIIGTCVLCSNEKVEINDIEAALNLEKRCKVWTAPGEFLILYNVIFNKKVPWYPLDCKGKIKKFRQKFYENLMFLKYSYLLSSEFNKLLISSQTFFEEIL